MNKPDYTDAEFEVVEPAEPPPKVKWSPWPWHYRWTFDWSHFWILTAIAVGAFIVKGLGR